MTKALSSGTRRLRTLILLVLGFVAMGVLLEWTVTLVDPLKVRRLQDLRDLRAASIPAADLAPWLLRSGESLITQDGACPITATESGERGGFSVVEGQKRFLVFGSAVAFGYGVRADESFAARLAGNHDASVAVSAHPFRTRPGIAFSLERLDGECDLLVVVDRLSGGLSDRFLAIREGQEQRPFWSNVMPAVSDVVALMTGDVREEGGREGLAPLEPLLDRLRDRGQELGTPTLFVDLGADPRVAELCAQRGIAYSTYEEADQPKALELHPLLGFPSAYTHRSLADSAREVVTGLLEDR